MTVFFLKRIMLFLLKSYKILFVPTFLFLNTSLLFTKEQIQYISKFKNIFITSISHQYCNLDSECQR